MKAGKDIQVEDSPTLDTNQSTPQPTPLPEPENKPGIFKRALPWVLISVVFFIAGVGLVFFTLYQNTNNALIASKQDAAQLSAQLSSANVDLQKAKNDLSTSQAALADSNNALDKAQQLSVLYKFETDVNTARAALAKQDPSTARQALTIAKTDLTELQKTSISADNIAGLQPQLDLALTYLESDVIKASDAMDTLYTNLLLISGNIK